MAEIADELVERQIWAESKVNNRPKYRTNTTPKEYNGILKWLVARDHTQSQADGIMRRYSKEVLNDPFISTVRGKEGEKLKSEFTYKVAATIQATDGGFPEFTRWYNRTNKEDYERQQQGVITEQDS